MTTFELLHSLPPFLTIKHRGWTYENLTPAFILNGSKIWLCYVGDGQQFTFYERIEDQDELEDYVATLAEELRGVEVYNYPA